MVTKHTTCDRFTGKSYRRALAPALVSAVGLAFGDMADALVMGQRMGATGLAAVSLALPVFMILNVMMHGFGAGGSIRFAKYLGEGKQAQAQESFSQVIQIAFASGIVLALLGSVLLNPLMLLLGTNPADGALYTASRTYVSLIVGGTPLFFVSYLLNYYLRNDDNQKLASLGFTVGNLCDIALNILLVLVFKMGVSGAAASTILGQVISICFYLPGLFGRSHALRYHPVRPVCKEGVVCFRIGFSVSVQYIYQLFFFLMVNNILMRSLGENGVAVFDVLQSSSYLALYLYDGASKAAQPLISTYTGERNRDGSIRALRLSLAVGSLFGGSMCLLLALFAPEVCQIFGLCGADLLLLGSRALRIYCFGLLFAGISTTLESYFQSCEQDRCALSLATLRGAAILLPFTLLFFFLPIFWFWWLFPAVEILSLLSFGILYRRLSRSLGAKEAVLSEIITNSSSDISGLTARLEAFCEEHGGTPKQSYFAGMAVEEICLALTEKVAWKGDDTLIQVTLVAAQDGNFELHIRDNAACFNPFSVISQQTDAHARMDLDSMGMLVIKKKAKDFFYRNYQGFNTLFVKL